MDIRWPPTSDWIETDTIGILAGSAVCELETVVVGAALKLNIIAHDNPAKQIEDIHMRGTSHRSLQRQTRRVAILTRDRIWPWPCREQKLLAAKRSEHETVEAGERNACAERGIRLDGQAASKCR